MPEQNHSEDIDRKIDYARLFMRRDRPLPKPGCSWAFYIFLVLLAVAVAVMYVIYKTN
ncbi:MAG: hypothetical protein IKG81_06370 [Bacteroidales bacterium]|nr:hypothetical protein [Bacteroidales bacterium]